MYFFIFRIVIKIIHIIIVIIRFNIINVINDLIFVIVVIEVIYIKNLSNILNNNKVQKKSNKAVAPVDVRPDRCQTLTDCAKQLKKYGAAVAVLELADLQAFWLSIMSDQKASNKDRLSASKMYAESIGAFDKKDTRAITGGATYKWATDKAAPIDAEIVHQTSTEAEKES